MKAWLKNQTLNTGNTNLIWAEVPTVPTYSIKELRIDRHL